MKRKCRARIEIENEDEVLLVECSLPYGHKGNHEKLGQSMQGNEYKIIWEKGDALVCHICLNSISLLTCKQCGLPICRFCYNLKTKKCKRCSLKVL